MNARVFKRLRYNNPKINFDLKSKIPIMYVYYYCSVRSYETNTLNSCRRRVVDFRDFRFGTAFSCFFPIGTYTEKKNHLDCSSLTGVVRSLRVVDDDEDKIYIPIHPI